jgi:hypothetical protein
MGQEHYVARHCGSCVCVCVFVYACACVWGEHMMHATRGKVQVMPRGTCTRPRVCQGTLPAAHRRKPRSQQPSRAARDLQIAPIFYTLSDNTVSTYTPRVQVTSVFFSPKTTDQNPDRGTAGNSGRATRIPEPRHASAPSVKCASARPCALRPACSQHYAQPSAARHGLAGCVTARLLPPSPQAGADGACAPALFAPGPRIGVQVLSRASAPT